MICQYARIALVPIGLAWVLTTRKRIRKSTDELICKLHHGELDAISNFIPGDPLKALMESDPEFYRAFGGYKGFFRKLEDAVCFVQLCQRLHGNNGMPQAKVGIVIGKAFVMLFAILGSIPEAVARVLFRRFPHLCARWMAQLYWDISIEAENLNLEYGTEKWISHA